MVGTQKVPPAPPWKTHGYTIRKRKSARWWEVLDPEGQMVCLTVYRRGAKEVVRRLTA